MFGGILCFCVCLTAALTYKLDLDEYDTCKEQGDELWSCKRLSSCPLAQQAIKKGKRPEICTYVNNTEPVVCCQPDLKDRKTQAVISKSKQKCQEYGNAVYLTMENPMGMGEVLKVDTCALVEPLITNGSPTQPREYPHMALIGYGRKNSIEWLCGGSLISELFVLSAGHCTDAGSKGLASWVRLGDYDMLSTKDDEENIARSVEYEIVERINHPEYKSPILYNDIALYKLNEKVKFNEYVRPICLQTEYTLPKPYAIATGWGRVEWGGRQSDTLLKANLTIIEKTSCADSYKAAIGRQLRNGIVDVSMLCAGDLKNGKDTCKGDSGGPLQIRLQEPYCMYSQVGITSFGISCAAGYPGIYTRVSHYVPWIESVVWP